MRQLVLARLVLIGIAFVSGQTSWAIDDPRTLTQSLEVRERAAQPRTARMRVGVTLKPYSKYMVKNQFGKVEAAFRTTAPLKRNIRARIDQVNQFYVSDWHLETLPLAWDRKTKKIRLQVRAYRRYGIHKTLEEVVGSIEVDGHLKGKDFLYNFSGTKSAKFLSAGGEPLLELIVHEPSIASENGVATNPKPPKTQGSL